MIGEQKGSIAPLPPSPSKSQTIKPPELRAI